MDKIVITSPRVGGRHAQNTDVKILLGLARIVDGRVIEEKKWPDAGLPVTVVQGVKVWVKPILRIPGRKSSKHRVMCECPNCAQVLSVGRLHQHVCAKMAA